MKVSSFVISVVALVISVLSFLSKNVISEEAKVFVFEGGYDVSGPFKADMNIAFVNNGEIDALISDIWLSVGKECDVEHGERIPPVEKKPLVSNLGNPATATVEFVGPEINEGTYRVCLYVETISGNTGGEEKFLGYDEIRVIDDSGQKFIVARDVTAWKRAFTVISNKKFNALW